MDIRPVTTANFDDLATLFEARGGVAYCWCRVWREILPQMNTGTAGEKRRIRKTGLRAEVEAGVHVGLLAYQDGLPIGWLSCGPKDSFPRLTGGADPKTTWAIVCFFLPREQRNHGLAGALLQAAIQAGRDWGATIIEAQPVTPASPSYRFMGYVSLFQRAGFDDLGPHGKRRHILQLPIGDPVRR